jgi:glycosyltransferase involved in cell wall biosynthesis
MNEPLRVAIYVPHGAVPDVRGYAPSIVAWNFARHLSDITPVMLSAREHYRQWQECVSGIAIHRFHEGRMYRRLFKKITRLDPYPIHRRAARILRREPWDILHAHQIEFPLGDFLKRVGQSRPVIVHAHVITHRFNPARGVAQRYVTVSEYVRDFLVEQKGYPVERLTVVPNGVDVDCFAPGRTEDRPMLRRRLGLPEGAPVIAYFGRKQQIKGFHTWLRTVKILLQAHPDLYALAVGPELDEARRDKSYAENQQIRRQLHAQGRFIELPAVPHVELGTVLQAVDIALLPSLAESQGLAVIEALASGCVTVSTNLGGIRESVRNGETGFLMEHPEDVNEAVSICEGLLQRTSTWPAIREKARADVLARYSWRVVTARLEQVYREVMLEFPAHRG